MVIVEGTVLRHYGASMGKVAVADSTAISRLYSSQVALFNLLSRATQTKEAGAGAGAGALPAL